MKAPKVLSRTLEIFNFLNIDVFIHLDKKIDIEDYKFAVGPVVDIAIWLEERKDIFWGGFSMIEVQLALIERASKEKLYDKYVMISDDSMLCVEQKRFFELISIDVDRISMRPIGNEDHIYDRYRKFFFFDHVASALMRGRRVEDANIDNTFLSNIKKITAMKITGGKKRMGIFYGSQWWILTRETASYILNIINSDKLLLDSFRYSAVPDEIMFHSIIGMKHYDARGGRWVPEYIHSGSPMFVDWSRHPKPYIFKNIEELPSSLDSHFLFIRKIDNNAEQIIDYYTNTVFG
jgi:hypothetical protein